MPYLYECMILLLIVRERICKRNIYVNEGLHRYFVLLFHLLFTSQLLLTQRSTIPSQNIASLNLLITVEYVNDGDEHFDSKIVSRSSLDCSDNPSLDIKTTAHCLSGSWMREPIFSVVAQWC